MVNNRVMVLINVISKALGAIDYKIVDAQESTHHRKEPFNNKLDGSSLF